ncbi:hypothetical protein AN478_05750 [Thiohalorhabdus denitrificans]|uniref:DUF3108 domain-containing protein n=1 Tax=Thiohalorhabdus denitrificans TaxID=381306 RepID=A0A0P9CNI1_9GAMM|nr:DUF3108 domain-containing protein [Thiohalorhabdus denitrificans]KPV40664.1 hypothetical protein AN478_05750 [Thiohalorhabdus denitrificans]SCY47691.1 Protein of unknown function [Thiohalorhabdus denitrificans]
MEGPKPFNHKTIKVFARPLWSTALLLGVAALLLPGLASASEYGWDGGFERLQFRVDWAQFPAGRAVIQAREADAGRAELRIEACTNALVDGVYKVRDRITARTRLTGGGVRALSYKVRRREGEEREARRARFARHGVVYTEDLESGRTDYFPVDPATMDVVTALYATRARGLEAGERFRIPVFDDGRGYELTVKVVGRERLDTVLGPDTPTVKVRPRLETDGIFAREGGLWVWFTDDRRHLPVRMESRIGIGSVTARLTAVEREPGEGGRAACL